MSGFWGMDPEQIQTQADRTGDAAERLNDLADRLRASVGSVPWTGPDADAFRELLEGAALPALGAASEGLRTRRTDLQQEAAQQELASSAPSSASDSSTGSGTPVGPGLPGLPGLPDIPFPDLTSQPDFGWPDIAWPDLGWPDIELPDWVQDRVESASVAAEQLGRDIGHAGEVWGDLLTGERVPTLAELVSSSALPVASRIGVGWNLITGEDEQFFSDRPAARVDPEDVHHQQGGTTPRSTSDLFEQLSEIGTSDGADRGTVQIQQTVGPDGQSRYIVYTPGTEASLNPVEGGWGAQGNSRDWSENVRMMAGQESAATENVRAAMEAAGVPAGADVMMVGHSQGGIVNSHLASDPDFNGPGGYNVTNVVSAGAPTESASMPASTEAISIQHGIELGMDVDGSREMFGLPVPVLPSISGDPIPALDFGGYRADGSYHQQGNYQEVTLEGNMVPVSDPVGAMNSNHSNAAYIDSVQHEVGSNPHGTLAQYEQSESVQNYLGPDSQVANTTTVEVGRVP